jgi:hypothetical protein
MFPSEMVFEVHGRLDNCLAHWTLGFFLVVAMSQLYVPPQSPRVHQLAALTAPFLLTYKRNISELLLVDAVGHPQVIL